MLMLPYSPNTLFIRTHFFILLNASYSSSPSPRYSLFFFCFCFVVDFFLLFLTRILHKFWFKTWLGNCSYVLSHHSIFKSETEELNFWQDTTTLLVWMLKTIGCLQTTLLYMQKKRRTANTAQTKWNMNGDPFMSSFHSR